MFKRFERVNCRGKHTASVSNRGMIIFGSYACAMNNLNGETARYVQLYFDEETYRIGFIFTTEKDVATVKVVYRRTNITFSAKSLLQAYRLLPKETASYEIKKEGEMYIIDLEKRL